jgi:hypothetical protein
LAAFLAIPATLFGQSGESGVGEVGAYGGGGFGGGAHALVGGSSGVAFSKHALALVEVSYTHLGDDILWRRHDVQQPKDSSLFDFMVGTHIRIPIGEKWAPYGILGGGLAFNTYKAYVGPQRALGGVDDFKMAFQTGGGVRYYIREGWGIRPEVKMVVSTRTYMRVSIGVFYTVGSNWP